MKLQKSINNLDSHQSVSEAPAPPTLLLLGVLAGHPGQAPLEVGEHVLHGFSPLLLTVELSLDRKCVP